MKRLVHKVLPGVILLFLWQFLCGGNERREFLFASPSLVFATAIEDAISLAFWRDVWVTFAEAFVGLAVGTGIGTLFGLLLWSNRSIAAAVKPYVIFFGAIPIFAVAPMFIVWFGTGILSKCIMAGCGVFFVALSQAFEGATSLSERLTLYLRSLGASQTQLLFKVVAPGTVRWMLAGLRTNIGLALMGAFIGEFVSSEAGIGHYILKAGSLYDVPRVLLGVFMLSGIALLLNAAVSKVSARYCDDNY